MQSLTAPRVGLQGPRDQGTQVDRGFPVLQFHCVEGSSSLDTVVRDRGQGIPRGFPTVPPWKSHGLLLLSVPGLDLVT